MKRNTGSALLIALITSLMVAGLTGAYLVVLHARQRDAEGGRAGINARQIADAGINATVSALNQGALTPPAPGETLERPPVTYGGGSYNVWLIGTESTTVISARGEFHAVTAQFSAVVLRINPPPLPPPGDAGAINIVGYPGTNLDLEFDDDITGTGVNGDDHPGIVVQDPDTFQSAEFTGFVDAIAAGVPPASKFKGNPTTTFPTTPEPIDLPFIQNEDLAVNQETLDDFREAMANRVNTVLVPAANQVFNGTQTITRGNYQFGTTGAPQIVVVNDSLTISGGQVSGSGTLIVRGELLIADSGKLNWDGDVIILGDSGGDSELRVDAVGQGNNMNLNIHGSLLALSSGGHDAALEIDDGNVKLAGMVMALSDSVAGGESEIELDGGNTEIHGILTSLGHQEAELEVDDDNSGPGGENKAQFHLVGAAFIGVTDPGGQVEADFEGNINIIYNQDFYTDALDRLNTLLAQSGTPLPPPAYKIVQYYRNSNP